MTSSVVDDVLVRRRGHKLGLRRTFKKFKNFDPIEIIFEDQN